MLKTKPGDLEKYWPFQMEYYWCLQIDTYDTLMDRLGTIDFKQQEAIGWLYLGERKEQFDMNLII